MYFGPAMSVVVATVALPGVYALDASILSAVPLLASAALLFAGYRVYARLNDRHLELERIYQFSQAVTSTPETDDLLRNVLRQAREMLDAETSSILFAAGEDHRLRVTLSRSDRLSRADDLIEPHDWVWERVMSGATVSLPRGTARNVRQRLWLDRRNLREADVVPLHGDAGVVGALLVANRRASSPPYNGDDVQLLQAVATHAGLALQNRRLLEQLRYEAFHDMLTGLPNRKLLQRRLAEILSAQDAPGSDGRRAAVFVLDLDGFKEVNDPLGHHSGDLVLQEVAARLKGAVPEESLVARLGGDEFAILCRTHGAEDDVTVIAQLILTSIGSTMTIHDTDVTVGVPIGAAIAPNHRTDGSSLLKQADAAMYAAKRQGVASACMTRC